MYMPDLVKEMVKESEGGRESLNNPLANLVKKERRRKVRLRDKMPEQEGQEDESS